MLCEVVYERVLKRRNINAQDSLRIKIFKTIV